jgi:glycosyltransferase involved in cell wall biosynthesis
MIYPTMGEGFGMNPFQAISTGMPTICTNITGCEDFAYLSVPLDAEWYEAKYNSDSYGSDTGLWAKPNYCDLINNMENVVNYYNDIKKATIQSAKILHETQSWSAVADKLIARLEKTNYF